MWLNYLFYSKIHHALEESIEALEEKNTLKLREAIKEELKEEIIEEFTKDKYVLTNEELELCDLLVSIPTSEEYPIMNVSHAVSVVLYELYVTRVEFERKIPFNVKMRVASKLEKEILVRLFNEFVDKSDIPDYRKDLCKVIFKRIVNRAFISGKEANTLMCVFKSRLKKD